MKTEFSGSGFKKKIKCKYFLKVCAGSIEVVSWWDGLNREIVV